MTDAQRATAIAEQIEAALEATCDALIALQLARTLAADATGDLEMVSTHASRALESLRRVVDELRLMLRCETSSTVEGFVLRGRRSVAVARATTGQPKPRRTA